MKKILTLLFMCFSILWGVAQVSLDSVYRYEYRNHYVDTKYIVDSKDENGNSLVNSFYIIEEANVSEKFRMAYYSYHTNGQLASSNIFGYIDQVDTSYWYSKWAANEFGHTIQLEFRNMSITIPLDINSDPIFTVYTYKKDEFVLDDQTRPIVRSIYESQDSINWIKQYDLYYFWDDDLLTKTEFYQPTGELFSEIFRTFDTNKNLIEESETRGDSLYRNVFQVFNEDNQILSSDETNYHTNISYHNDYEYFNQTSLRDYKRYVGDSLDTHLLYDYNYLPDGENISTYDRRRYDFESDMWILESEHRYYYSVLSDVNNLEEKVEIKTFPNPCVNRIFVKGWDKSSAPYKIVDAKGQNHGEGTFQIHKGIDVSNLVPGVYFLQAEGIQAIKFIKGS